ncbi:uncharacterized protein BT62DRAFT_542876 [Guyanagaster necrorhizus]|uniref:Uncharacterized protein n=1 Tax=Guyanagaster necrorhizus TaxID=856835 RepID=A0A9P7W406_9AGAR|nr:uncharacterized protein BT62DRAFT_542876 [Guyanagaster necrorhizus MCA 3950]KAG7450896.1 hypothetical protein BT62DRAFT_542876 [Guyanagaster necrorhizus MCA 3950]
MQQILLPRHPSTKHYRRLPSMTRTSRRTRGAPNPSVSGTPSCTTPVQPEATVKFRRVARRLPKRPPLPFIFPPPDTPTRRRRRRTRHKRKATKKESDDDDDDNDEMEVPPVPPVAEAPLRHGRVRARSESVMRMLMGSMNVPTPPSSPAPVREGTPAPGPSSFFGSYVTQVGEEAKDQKIPRSSSRS